MRTDFYYEFCSLKDIISTKISIDGNTVEKWVSVMTEVKIKGVKSHEMNKTLGFVLSIPTSNAHTERIFSLMNNKWTDDRNQCNTELSYKLVFISTIHVRNM